MSDEITKTTHTSWVSRLLDSLKGMFFGLILLVGAIYLIFWNEARSLHTSRALTVVSKMVISIPSGPINRANDNKVIHISDIATTPDILQDPVFDVSVQAIKLNRKVEMYQWVESKEQKSTSQVGGSQTTETKYTYKKDWADKPIDSNSFIEKEGHQNPPMPLGSYSFQAQNVTVGDFYLPPDLIAQITGDTLVDLSKKDYSVIEANLKQPVHHLNGGLFIGKNPDAPEIGNLRIVITNVLPQPVSVIGKQAANVIQPYIAPSGTAVALLAMGRQAPEQMIFTAQKDNQTSTWLIRLVALFLLVFALMLLVQPIVILADVIPFLGSFARFGMFVFGLIGGIIIWCVTIAIAWFAVKPFMSVVLLAIVVAILSVIFFMQKKRINN